jgi:hypothetical protein
MTERLTTKDFMCPFSPCPSDIIFLSGLIVTMCCSKDTSVREIAMPSALPLACDIIE